MGQKLILNPDDPFFEPDQVRVVGIAGSCYCCNQQIHIHFQSIDELPLAKINKEHYYVYLCDQCEDDINTLNLAGVKKVSYDVLWIIQEPLENELAYLDDTNGGITSIDREDILIRLYKETLLKMNNNSANRYLEKLSEEENDEPENKKQSKKDS